ncbi:dUTP diphosphatase [Alicyclobacillus mali]|uniref:Deoxyuridine 5'-triphosphate nucleotidohydrolase n=1 Tax=Alicyclobacillus mali (ex Roth et al. 2021) TaxID=1123961 RepID=A0ABS0F1L6_9BACL|nr:dUTP diphosphatase [Alicyclobacillus mali (ex Roth et al. 2021)]MBF8377190.1 dUTP diphosphatase [Alicyclobacillus mali (ex Roth et al. 2021)]MCL6490069.1 dUTP diphosphatase [Alicyclobacillus mali (ex Roth et al. 2021)]
MDVRVKMVSPLLTADDLPRYATQGSAGLDLRACLDSPLIIRPGEIAPVPTGLAIQLPRRDAVALVFARSGLAARHGIALANGVGVIDSDYTGEIVVPLIHQGAQDFVLQPKERIAQLVIAPIYVARLVPVDDLGPTARGGGGFGSTGRL